MKSAKMTINFNNSQPNQVGRIDVNRVDVTLKKTSWPSKDKTMLRPCWMQQNLRIVYVNV